MRSDPNPFQSRYSNIIAAQRKPGHKMRENAHVKMAVVAAGRGGDDDDDTSVANGNKSKQ